ncbi:hypothetical protein [Actinoplanes sp. GCM10030250]|uniref:hypothetical protein n=1 Tax=Actinoplanes sp. GCM10030250 TaxID=3273376 RepID=UPI003613F952
MAALVAKWANRIQDFVRSLLDSMRRLRTKLAQLTGILERLAHQLHRLSRTDPTAAPAGRSFETGGEMRLPRNIMDYELEWADDAYDMIRASDDDLPFITEAARDHGFTPADIGRIKSHLFREQHLLDSYSEGEMGLFDANPRIAEAWQRLVNGQPHPADLDLLRHERYEAEFMARTGDPSYRRAHAATIEAGFTWDPEAAAADGLGYQREK